MSLTFWWHLFTLLAVEAGVVITAAALVARRIKSAARQRTVRQTAVVTLLALVVCELTGAGRLLWPWAAVPESPRQERTFVVRTTSSTLEDAETGMAHSPAHTGGQPPVAKASPATAVWWPGLCWLAGAVLLVARNGLARGLLLWRWRRHSRSDESLQLRVRLLACRMKLRQHVRTTVAAGLSGPVAFGVFRPSICLPEGFTSDFTAAQQEAMLAHELAHVAGRDPGWHGLADLMVALWWWHPLVWRLRRTLQAATEDAADDASLLVEDGPGALAECLVVMGRRLTRAESCGWLGIEGNGFRSSLGRRVTRLLTLPGREWHGPGRAEGWVAGAAGALTLAVVLGASATWTAHADSERSTPQPVWENSPAGRAWEAMARAGKSGLLAQAVPAPASAAQPAAEPIHSGVKPSAKAARAGLAVDPRSGATPTALHTRTFVVDRNTMTLALQKAAPPVATGVPQPGRPIENQGEQLRAFLASFGADLRPPKSFFFNDRTGVLMVRGTLADLELIEQVLQVLNGPPPQVTIEIKFVELTDDETRVLGFDWLRSPVPVTTTLPPHDLRSAKAIGEPRLQSATNLPLAPLTAILSPEQFRGVLSVLEKRHGVNILSAPKVTTLSGRPAQIKSVYVRYVVTDLDLREKDKIQPVAEPFEFGPVLDVIPYVTADGYRVQMTLIPSVTEFLGYDTNRFEAKAGANTQLVPLPTFRLRQVIANATAWDAQTVVVGPGSIEVEEKPDPAAKGPAKTVRKNLLIFVTPTIIDPAGNRVHSEEEVARRAANDPKPAR